MIEAQEWVLLRFFSARCLHELFVVFSAMDEAYASPDHENNSLLPAAICSGFELNGMASLSISPSHSNNLPNVR